MKKAALLFGFVFCLFLVFSFFSQEGKTPQKGLGVCPPFPLKDEKGEIINPVKGINYKAPYSPKQTCGGSGCHNYEKITEGFHFQQGKGEKLPEEYGERYNWVLYPGNYGGNWCSPAPLYRQLAPKKNTNPRLIDMTSFEFVTATCGNCHPGGGPLEYDRDGFRYDEKMNDPSSGFISGGDNNFDGDYYKARWNETGVIEADCLLCHQPEYSFKKRNEQIAKLNFKWAATSGAKLGEIIGSVKDGEKVEVNYDKSLFDENGNVSLHIVPEPRNTTCLNCHFKPDWKKRGAGYSERTDVHIKAGLKCVDCHSAGSKAKDERIREKELHQFGKGDDPSGFVRNDLDDTVRTCEDCHLKRFRNAPLAKHSWLPPLHLERLSCQACHIPNRTNESALVQASDVYNKAPRISPAAKHIWTFYDQKMNFWNHYGELELFGAEDKPTDISEPTLINYKGKIYPANRVHSSFVGLEEEGKKGLNQLFMKDFYKMWVEHNSSPQINYPELNTIKDDNDDGVLEINRPEEIDAVLSASKKYLEKTNFPLDGKKIVYVADSRVYYSSTEFRDLPKKDYEATPYASVYKYSHDVSPAKAAFGSGGCVDCHSFKSSFFRGKALKEPFSFATGKPVWVEKYRVMGISPFWVKLGEIRESFLKPIIYFCLGLILVLGAFLFFAKLSIKNDILSKKRATIFSFAATLLALAGVFILSLYSGMIEYIAFSRFAIDSAHFLIGAFLTFLSLYLFLQKGSRKPQKLLKYVFLFLFLSASVFGGLMILKFNFIETITKLSYTLFDSTLAMISVASIIFLLLKMYYLSKEGLET